MKILNLKKKILLIYLFFFLISTLVFLNSNFYNQKKTSFVINFTESQLNILNIEQILLKRTIKKNKLRTLNFEFGNLLPQNNKQYSYKKNFVLMFFHLNTLNIPITQNKVDVTIKNQLRKNCNFFLTYKKNSLDKYLYKEISNLIKEKNIKQKLLLSQFEFLSSEDFEFLNDYGQNYFEYLSIIEIFSKKKFNDYLDFKIKIMEILNLQKKKLIYEKLLNLNLNANANADVVSFIYDSFENQNFYFLINESQSFNEILKSCLNLNLIIDTLEKNSNYKKKKLFLFFFTHIILILMIIFYRSKLINTK